MVLHTLHSRLLAMGGNIKNNVKHFVSNINLYVISHLYIMLALPAAAAAALSIYGYISVFFIYIFIKSNLL